MDGDPHGVQVVGGLNPLVPTKVTMIIVLGGLSGGLSGGFCRALTSLNAL